jgi:hypothetical protein
MSIGSTWAGNLKPGLGGLDDVRRHPNGRGVLVASKGNLWQVDPIERTAQELAPAVFAVWKVADRLVYDNQGLWFLCLGSSGWLWQTRRISWDGFDQIDVGERQITGQAWSPVQDRWLPFSVDLQTGAVEGGSYIEIDSFGRIRLP